ncbi:hypothetical protein [Vitreoscilla stercoraria]|uniref:Uncharacterized protein n=1 Tax=Vitreoscilla stercoraria TaxID=61 RepID=A0ABY4EAN3_VITST|nr:hypothetical protein [Vitreoscilla stercoraria]UOO92806.1 hypothetical protein LVJ81_01800 [Vitreoscilla stercoraria]
MKKHLLGFTLLLSLPIMTWANPALSTVSPAQKRISKNHIPKTYQTQWQKAENRNTCAPLVLPSTAPSHIKNASIRPASFHGGWGIAYDLPNKRSAYGIAGAGITGSLEDVSRWSQYHVWNDGSGAGWGLEGDTGPGHLAYVYLNTQGCLYNVWSNVSETHLINMLNDLRLTRH